MQRMRIGGFGESYGAQYLDLGVCFSCVEWTTKEMGLRPPFIISGGNLIVGVSDHQTSSVRDRTSPVNNSRSQSRLDKSSPPGKSGGGLD
jgi:hypothetical protein